MKNDEAQFGPDCEVRYREALQIIETSETEVGALFLLDDATVQRWLGKMRSALIWSLKSQAGTTKMKHLEFARYSIVLARKAAQAESFELKEAA